MAPGRQPANHSEINVHEVQRDIAARAARPPKPNPTLVGPWRFHLERTATRAPSSCFCVARHQCGRLRSLLLACEADQHGCGANCRSFSNLFCSDGRLSVNCIGTMCPSVNSTTLQRRLRACCPGRRLTRQKCLPRSCARLFWLLVWCSCSRSRYFLPRQHSWLSRCQESSTTCRRTRRAALALKIHRQATRIFDLPLTKVTTVAP